MTDGNGNPPIDFDRAIRIGGGGELPVPTAQDCLANAASETPPDQVTAMALVGILYQLEQQTEAESGRLAILQENLVEHAAASDSVLDELRDRLDAHGRTFDRFTEKTDAMQGYEGALMEKLDAYRDRLEVVEKGSDALNVVLDLRETTISNLLQSYADQELRMDDLLDNLRRAGFAWEKPTAAGQ